ncbi:MAG: nickel pincer cofactor biosynthesis protein LarB [Halobacteriales archaeon]
MRDVLEALAEGEVSVAEAESRLAGYATTDAGRFDAAREGRRGVPEAILGDEKSPEAVADLATTALATTGRAIVTRSTAEQRDALREALDREGNADASIEVTPEAGTVVVHGPEFERPSLPATVAIVTAGTGDAGPAGEATVIAREMGATVERIDDVGVAGIHRLFGRIEAIRAADVAVVAAGREGALPTVVAGLVDSPVIGLPVSVGYGEGGDGEAALLGMLQSCAALSVVNVDAGFVAGAQAGLIARAVEDGGD